MNVDDSFLDPSAHALRVEAAAYKHLAGEMGGFAIFYGDDSSADGMHFLNLAEKYNKLASELAHKALLVGIEEKNAAQSEEVEHES